MQTRWATQHNTALLVQLRVDFLRALRPFPAAEEEALRRGLAEYFAAAFAENSFAALLAYEDELPAGCVYLSFSSRPPSDKRTNPLCAHVSNVFVYPAFRGRGLATTLVGAAMQQAKRRGVGTLELVATGEGEPIYRRFGFAPPAALAMEVSL